MCTCCTYGIGVLAVLCACRTCYVAGMQYYVCELCSCGIVIYVFIVLYSVYIFLFCCTLGVGVRISLLCTPDVGVCYVL